MYVYICIYIRVCVYIHMYIYTNYLDMLFVTICACIDISTQMYMSLIVFAFHSY